ncbi:MAG: glycosyltransferase, partial [Nitrospirae bacterium]|nr:glycosyltransferase [Nitrospirota bacterium]
MRFCPVSVLLDSVLSQSCKPEEIIVVDDCSTDGTGDILDSYEDKITVVHLPQNSGPSKARNEGIKHARTEWLAFLDSDDYWEKDKLKDQVEYLRRCPFYEILQSEEVWIRNGKRVNACKHHKKPFGWIWQQSLERCLISPSGVLVKKSLLERYGSFDESLPVCEDYDLWLKISRHHPVGLETSLSVVKYGGHKGQLSHQYPAMDRFRVKSLV